MPGSAGQEAPNRHSNESLRDRTGTADAGAVGTPPAKENGPSVQTRKLRSVAKLGELLDGDIHHIGIALLAASAEKICQSLNDCDESLGLDGLDLKTKLRILDLKSAFVAQEMSLAETLLDWKRGRFPPSDDNPRRQPSFAPREQVFPAMAHERGRWPRIRSCRRVITRLHFRHGKSMGPWLACCSERRFLPGRAVPCDEVGGSLVSFPMGV